MQRRSFITKTFLTGGSLAIGTNLIGCKENTQTVESNESVLIEANKKLEQVELTFQNSSIRQPVHKLDVNSDIILAYKDAVKQMKNLPNTNPLSWEFQASIHNNHCVHSNWFFLPWHRAYLYFFESICRKLSGLESFALPYWDWTEFPQIPETFWGDNNSLFNNSRRINENSTASLEFIGANTINNVLELKDFDSFGSHRRRGTGQLEGTPHNYIHRFISGDMVTLMSPLDPIFWCHHANVDRIWSEWNGLGNDNPAEKNWVNHSFNNQFVDSQGNPTEIQVEEMNSTTKLGYTYESNNIILQNLLTNASNLPDEIKLFSSTEFNTQPQWLENSLKLSQNNILTINEIIEEKPKSSKRVKLKIKGITPPSNEDFFVRIFINCPYLTKETPINDPNYIGSFTFFGTEHVLHNSMNQDLEYIFDITDKYKNALMRQSNNSEELNVQLISIPIDNKSKLKFDIKPAEIELIIT